MCFISPPIHCKLRCTITSTGLVLGMIELAQFYSFTLSVHALLQPTIYGLSIFIAVLCIVGPIGISSCCPIRPCKLECNCFSDAQFYWTPMEMETLKRYIDNRHIAYSTHGHMVILHSSYIIQVNGKRNDNCETREKKKKKKNENAATSFSFHSEPVEKNISISSIISNTNSLWAFYTRARSNVYSATAECPFCSHSRSSIGRTL